MEFKQLQSNMIAAMKAKDKVRKEALSSIIAAAKKVAIDEGQRDNISEELVTRVIMKEIKTAQEQVDTCPAARTDLLEEYTTYLNILKEYAPKMMSAEEVETYITTNHAEVVATKNKGMIMKNVMKELKGKADGKVINEVVANLCK